jgi:hypothetical protein
LPQYPTKPLEVLEVGPGGSLGFFFKLQLKKKWNYFQNHIKDQTSNDENHDENENKVLWEKSL